MLTLSYRYFRWHAPINTFSAELSELELEAALDNIRDIRPIFRKGFFIQGKKETRFFRFVESVRSGDGEEIVAWKFQDSTGISVVIFND